MPEKQKAKLGLGLEEYSKSEVFPEDSNPREKMRELAKLIFDRRLTDAGGGNLSCHVGDRVYITPRYLGELHRFNLDVDRVIILGMDGSVIDGDADMVTREGSIHMKVYNTFPEIRAILHAHPRNIVPFASLGIPVPANTEMFKHLLGENSVDICDEVGPATDLLSETIIDHLSRRKAELAKYGAAVMIPNHGLIVAGRNLDYAYSILETVDTSAYVAIQMEILRRGNY